MTLGTHADPALTTATAAAARALTERLTAAGWAEHWPVVLDAVPVLAEVAVHSAWADLKRANRRPTEDGRGPNRREGHPGSGHGPTMPPPPPDHPERPKRSEEAH